MAARTPTDAETTERVRALLQRWQQSLDLHLRYLSLDDAHYWHVQPWPKHERPAAWIVNLARDKVTQLSRLLEAHTKRGDHQFALGLEEMLFLANLVGLQPADRHIPLADKNSERREALTRPRTARGIRGAAGDKASTATRPTLGAQAPPISPRERLVIEDAIRLLQWGRQWHELGELIARIAERPGLTEVRRTLRTHRAQIERAAADKP
jgi:hypothetical protein